MSQDNIQNIAYIIILLSNLLSILACGVIICVYILAKNLRVYAFKLAFLLSVLDLLKSASMLIPTYSVGSSSYSCILQASSYQFFTISSFLITLLIAVSLYICILKDVQDIESYHYYYLVFVFLLSAAGTVPLFCFQYWGKTNYWCWIKQEYRLARFLTFYGPLWLENIVNMFLYYQIIKKLKNDSLDIYRLRFYPIILIFCYFPGTVTRILEALDLDPPVYLILITAFFDGILGLVNSVCYGLTKHVKDYLKSALCIQKQSVYIQYNDINSYSYLSSS